MPGTYRRRIERNLANRPVFFEDAAAEAGLQALLALH